MDSLLRVSGATHERSFARASKLIGNAIKFTHAGGMVTLDAIPMDGWARFAVHDTGPGIVASDLASIFDRYWQVRRVQRASSRRTVEGSGPRA